MDIVRVSSILGTLLFTLSLGICGSEMGVGNASMQDFSDAQALKSLVSSNRVARLNSEISQNEALQSLLSITNAVRLNAAMQLDNRRRQLILNLLEVLESTNSDIVKLDSVIVLGQYRISEAVPLLVQHLEWDELRHLEFDSGHMLIEERMEVDQPVSSALIAIGLPAIDPLLRGITETDNTNITMKCVRVCNAIEGLNVTEFRLHELLLVAPDTKIRERIQSALNILANWKASALGPGGIPELLGKIAETDNRNMILPVLFRLEAIEGRQLTRFLLQGALDKETDGKRKGRIQSALDAVK